MTKLAIRAAALPEEAEKRSSRIASETRKAARKSTLSGRTFEDLNPQEKDLLLKELAIRSGLIDDSDDS